MALTKSLSDLWTRSDLPPDIFEFARQHDAIQPEDLVPLIIIDQQNRWKTDSPLNVEDYLHRLPQLAESPRAKVELAIGEYKARSAASESPPIEEFVTRFHDVGDSVRELLYQLVDGDSEGKDVATPAQLDASLATLEMDAPTSISQLGRYRLLRLLGEGAFGRVFLAFDEELERQVAIKVPANDRFEKPDDAEQYLAEARTVASLDHPHIVPVYDMGRTEEGSVFVVSKYIEGTTLEDRLQEDRPDPATVARWLSSIASALHHAHQRRLVHRDVKPGNILLEGEAVVPYIADFGLAIREEDFLRDARVAGTPAYMSPEQVRGEGHRLDARSDIFALGVVLYESLTGKRPFRGSTRAELAVQITTADPIHPRTVSEKIPAELERICLKAIAKRVGDRYRTAKEMAEELRQWDQPTIATPRELTVVPKGLRSFASEDADFFLALLPGPVNRDGLPNSIQFWKTRIEETDADRTFSVGLIYGPSGCGKSSLVKAGLLPSLSNEVLVVYIEATPDDTEQRLLRGLRRVVPEVAEGRDLVTSLAWVRQRDLPRSKVVLILDQFEQWLHANDPSPEAELVKALRQCDGAGLQAIVMVRDDFAMAAARFMDAIDVPILQGNNFATVDLFDVDHARRVLIKFGQAFGKLPTRSDAISDAQRMFVEESVNGLADESKVVSVQISLFADMVKDREWLPATLEEVGGTEGVGANFLEETFESRTANPNHKRHSEAMREVLQALLPEIGSDIKGHMRSDCELMQIVGYGDQPGEIREVLRILDAELRLITPTDGDGNSSGSESNKDANVHRYYQLTHDYLVPSLREWLTRKQRETKRGRAELKLAERAAAWQAKPENKQLPTMVEWLQIRRWTRQSTRSRCESQLLSRASRYHVTRLAFTLSVAFILIAVAAFRFFSLKRVAEQQRKIRVAGLVETLASCRPSVLPEIIRELDEYPSEADEFLDPLLRTNPGNVAEQEVLLNAQLASLSRDPTLVEPLFTTLLDGPVTYLLPTREMLRPRASELINRLEKLAGAASATATDAKQERRFRAIIALADYAPEKLNRKWDRSDRRFVVQQLLQANPDSQAVLREGLRPLKDLLLDELELFFLDSSIANESIRVAAASALADYAADDVPRLTELLTVASPQQYRNLYPVVTRFNQAQRLEQLRAIAKKQLPLELDAAERIDLGRKRAGAAVTMLRLGAREEIFPLFAWSDDPEAITQFIFGCRPRGVGIEALLECLDLVAEDSEDQYPPDSRYALLLALGEFTWAEVPDGRRENLLNLLAGWYETHPRSSVHGATGWLLRHWGHEQIVRRVDETERPYSPDREWFTVAVQAPPVSYKLPIKENGVAEEESPSSVEEKGDADANKGRKATRFTRGVFYFTFVVFQAKTYELGTEDGDTRSGADERLRKRRINRPFAVLDRELTMEELLAFNVENYGRILKQFPADEEVAGYGMDWFDAVDFCRWLTTARDHGEANQAFPDPANLDKQLFPKYSGMEFPENWPMDLDRTGFRLLTDDEWEVMARGGSQMAYAFGGDARWLDEFAWYQPNADEYRNGPKQLRPTLRGLFDVHGSRGEWVYDWYNFNLDLSSGPLGPEKGADRSQRGGAFYTPAEGCRAADRGGRKPTDRRTGFGTRICVTLQHTESEPQNGPAGREQN